MTVIVVVESVRTYNLTLPQWAISRYQLRINEMNNITEEQFEEMGQYVVRFEIIFDGKSMRRETMIQIILFKEVK